MNPVHRWYIDFRARTCTSFLYPWTVNNIIKTQFIRNDAGTIFFLETFIAQVYSVFVIMLLASHSIVLRTRPSPFTYIHSVRPRMRPDKVMTNIVNCLMNYFGGKSPPTRPFLFAEFLQIATNLNGISHMASTQAQSAHCQNSILVTYYWRS